MFKSISIILMVFLTQILNAAPSDDFVIRVQTNILNGSGLDQFIIPTLGSLTYNYDVDCNDDAINEATGVTGDYTCDYSTLGGAGIKTIRIKTATGTGFPRIYFNDTGDKNKILSVEQWGFNKWESMNKAFKGAVNLSTTASDSPDFSNVTSLAEMFKGATSVNPNTSNWNTSTITSFTGMFQGATSANPDVSNWNTSSSQRFKYMFDGAINANPNTTDWDSDNVLEMEYMFRGAISANPDLSNWDIESVSSIQGMFENVTLSIPDYDNILVLFASQNVNSGLSFHGGSSKFCDQTSHDFLDNNKSWTITDSGIGPYCTEVDDFVITIKTDNSGPSGNTEFTIPTKPGEAYEYDVDCNNDGIDDITGATGDETCIYPSTGTYTVRIKYNHVTNAGFPQIYFNDSGDKDKILTVEQWGSNPWASMDSAFQGASNLTATANGVPNFSNLTSLTAMFRDATSVNPNTANWDISLVEDISYMFNNAISANPNTSNWDTSSVINMRHMFSNATSAIPDTTYWNTSSTVNMSYMFNNAISANPNTSNWNIEHVFNMTNMFSGVTLPTSDYDAMLIGFSQQAVTTSVFFDGGNSKYCLVAARNVLENDQGWLITDGNLDSSCPYSSNDFIIVANTNNASSGSPSDFTIPTFPSLAYNYNVDCDSDGVLETTGETGDYKCEYATKGIKIISIKDNFFGSGFPSIYLNNNSEKLELISIEQWGIGHWTTMEKAFYGANSLTISANAGNPDFSSVSSMEGMFWDAYDANPNTLDWDTSSVLNMTNMFNDAYQARPDVRHWDVSQVNAFNNMFAGVTLPTNLYDILLISFATQPIQTNKIINIGSSKYCAIAAHDILDNDKSWIILDGGIDSNCPIPAEDFVFTVKTNNSGDSTNQQFTIPTLSSLAYNYDVDCNNDMSYEAIGITGDYTCDYSTMGGIGTYTIRVKTIVEPGFPRIYFNGGGDVEKLLTIVQWGNNPWKSMNSAFEGATNLTSTATDTPDLSNATSLAEMFKDATSVNPTTINWDTSTITSFTGMFQGAISANPDTSIWNTSLVQRFKYMFDGASNANPNTSSWITNNVLEMEYMFRDATSANPNMTSWNIENVTSIQGMFENVTLPTTTYDNILSTFAVQNVNTGLSFSGGNSKFCAQAAHDFLDITNTWTMTDAGLDSICPDPLGDFVITIKTDHPGTSANTEFTIPALGSTNDYNVDCNNDGINEILGATSDSTCVYPIADTYTVRIKYNQVTNTGFSRIYFNGGGDAEKLLTIEQWGTNPWSSMNGAFRGTTNLTTTAADIPDFSNVTSMNVMFKDATLVTPNTSNWDTSSIKIMYGMFENATLANPDTSNWNTTLVETMSFMFSGSTSANPSTSSWNIEKVTSMVNMFSGVTLPTADYDAMLSGFSQQTVKQDVNFHGGNSKFCAQAAHDILDITNSWNMIDGGLDSNCPTEDIFSDGFENIVITFKSTETSIKYDFGTVSGDSLSETPSLIAQGLNEHDIPTIEINIRRFEGETQIRRSYLYPEDIEGNIWTHDDWQLLESTNYTNLHW